MDTGEGARASDNGVLELLRIRGEVAAALEVIDDELARSGILPE